MKRYSKLKLKPYQREAVDYLVDPRNKETAVFASMGTGKTAITLNALADIKAQSRWAPTLVLAPLYVAESVWPEQTKLWTPELSYTLIRAKGRDSRTKLLKCDTDLYFCNYEMLNWLAHQPEFRKFRFLIMDELSRLKSTNSVTHRILRKLLPQFPRRIGLTGMPLGKHFHDLFGEMMMVDSGKTWKRKGKDFENIYFDKYVRPGTWYAKFTLKGPKEKTKIIRKVRHRCLVVREQEHLKLPPIQMNDIWIDLPPDQRNIYDTVVKGGVVDGQRMNKGTLTKMQQFNSGFLYGEDGEARLIHNLKLYAARELLEDYESEGNTLIAYQYLEEAKQLAHSFAIRHRIGGRRQKSSAARFIREWNRGDVSRMLIHPKSAGHGLNLQTGGHHLLWYSLPWSFDLYEQTVARLRRLGQTHEVLITRLLVRGTIDEQIVKVLQSRSRTQDEFMSTLAQMQRT